MKLITTPYRPSQYPKTLPTIAENEVAVFNAPNFRKFARENQALSMREPFISKHIVRVKAHHDLTTVIPHTGALS